MDTFDEITNLNTQELPEENRERIIANCSEFLRRANATKALSDALAAEKPDFPGFQHSPLTRIKNLFSGLAGDSVDGNLALLQELDLPTIVTLGLCLSTTKIKRMNKDDLEEVIHQAKEIGSRIKSIIYTSVAISQSIQLSVNPVLVQEFNQQAGEYISSMIGNHHVAWNNSVAYAETVPPGNKFQGLTALALNRMVTVYLPLATKNDCGIRLTALFSEALLGTLFGYRPGVYGDRLELSALTHEVAPILGEDVFRSIQATTTWERVHAIRTSCVKATVTTADDLERLWTNFTNETFHSEKPKKFHEYPAGSITVFDCDASSLFDRSKPNPLSQTMFGGNRTCAESKSALPPVKDFAHLALLVDHKNETEIELPVCQEQVDEICRETPNLVSLLYTTLSAEDISLEASPATVQAIECQREWEKSVEVWFKNNHYVPVEHRTLDSESFHNCYQGVDRFAAYGCRLDRSFDAWYMRMELQNIIFGSLYTLNKPNTQMHHTQTVVQCDEEAASQLEA
ncbi:hypothetical protein FBEOM_3051 [Fusarium beomiforme]|uniref:Uncharacterized protein n=1 Tax=Fusarium beomiforme TaxID=44412 RepID=A0A9P5AQQ7_9HYPO|nr:hypothetical protein FBEOM_3051 [Fusarium beomiforme]